MQKYKARSSLPIPIVMYQSQIMHIIHDAIYIRAFQLSTLKALISSYLSILFPQYSRILVICFYMSSHKLISCYFHNCLFIIMVH